MSTVGGGEVEVDVGGVVDVVSEVGLEARIVSRQRPRKHNQTLESSTTLVCGKA